jgi:hypothetical protein
MINAIIRRAVMLLPRPNHSGRLNDSGIGAPAAIRFGMRSHNMANDTASAMPRGNRRIVIDFPAYFAAPRRSFAAPCNIITACPAPHPRPRFHPAPRIR